MTKKKQRTIQTHADDTIDNTSSSSSTPVDSVATPPSTSASTIGLQAFNNIQFSRPEDQEISDSSSSSEDTLLYPSHYVSILQQIYDICDARIARNKVLAKYIESLTTIQELKESNILSLRTIKDFDKNNTWSDLEKKGWNNIKVILLDGGVHADIKKYENINKKITELQSLIVNVLEKKDISITSSPQEIRLEIELIKIYCSLIIQFWLEEEGGKKVDMYYEGFREYYYVNLIKQYWEQLLSMSFNVFHKEYYFTMPATYTIDISVSLKIIDKDSYILFKEKEYQAFIDNLSEKYKKFSIKLNALRLKETEKFAKLTEVLDTEKTKIINFFDGNIKLINAIKKLFSGTTIDTKDTKAQCKNIRIEDGKIIIGDSNRKQKPLRIPTFSDEEKYFLYISCKYLQDILQQLEVELERESSPKNHHLTNKLIKKLKKLKIEEDSTRKILNQQEDQASKKISTAIDQEYLLIDCKAKLESEKSTEAIRRNNIEKEEQKSREGINISLQRYLQKKANLEKQTKRPPTTQKEKVSSTEDKRKQIVDTRIFTIEPEIIIANFKLLENLLNNTNSLTFQQAQAIVAALGGIIESNRGGGSHHKILFHERLSSCFDTVDTVVRPHGKDKQNEITGFALQAFKAAIVRILPDNWRSLPSLYPELALNRYHT